MPDDKAEHRPLAPVENHEPEQALRNEGDDQGVHAVAGGGKSDAENSVAERITRDARQVNRLEIEVPIQQKARRPGGGLDQADDRQRPDQRRDARLLEESGRGLGKQKHR